MIIDGTFDGVVMRSALTLAAVIQIRPAITIQEIVFFASDSAGHSDDY